MRSTKNSENIEHIAKNHHEVNDNAANVLNFSSTLRELRKNVSPELVRQREGRRDLRGNVHMVEYIEWHTVADILDRVAPNWTHSVKDIRPIGSIMTVTVAITIDGITREGIGTGRAGSETGIKKAEHDALKRAAVKFGIARDLYKKENETHQSETSVSTETETSQHGASHVARNLGDLVTGRQLGMIRALGRETGVDLNKECDVLMKCNFDELSKSSASQFITHLQELKQNIGEAAVSVPMRKAG
ncbi:MAG: Rad52/Rad22 family DNA repair protein [Acidobacteriota bacterium]